MQDFERVVLAGLVHGLGGLFERAGVALTEAMKRLLVLGELEDPVLAVILEQAHRYAAGGASLEQALVQAPLVSIFSRVHLWHPEELRPSYHRLAPLPDSASDQTAIFPTESGDLEGLNAHVEEFARALDDLTQSVDVNRFDHLYNHLLAVLQRYTWCLAGHAEDVALFDHLKLTSAIAACLYRYHEGDMNADRVKEAAGEERFCLLVGDLSGIQDYIFDITTIGAGGVARRLRARSFFMSLLSDGVSHLIADRLEVPLGNVIMASGGKFYLLAPNLGQMEDRVKALQAEIDGWLRAEFNGEIGANLAQTCFSGQQFSARDEQHEGFGDVMTRLSFKLNTQKRRRGMTVLQDGDGWIEKDFAIERDFWGRGACLSCRKFPAVVGELCEQCDRDVKLGKVLPRVKYVAYYPTAPSRKHIKLPGGYAAVVFPEGELSEVGEPYLVANLNDPELKELRAYPAAFRYLANYVPLRKDGTQLSFEDIAEVPEGRELLGYVKADVDYLGILFAQGLRRDEGGYDTAAHMAALSRELDLFFSGWMQHTLSQKQAYQSFYTIFSGGDDVLLVGPWDKAAKLAREVHDQFTAFVSGNPDITLSAGLLFTKHRYPIARAAEDAERVLERSKEKEWTDATGRKRSRDHLTVLGDTFHWREAPEIFGEIETLIARSEFLTSAFLYDLVEYSRLYDLWAKEGKIEGLRYKALFAYNIARNLRKGDEYVFQWADTLMQSLHGERETVTMGHLGLIATYVLFSKRGRQND
ncbi:MAG: type III-A CRISPR-associated protein Cas10/Csm1 [Anaerolineales bacterium]|nr:type III-A CRISPR-associated protein Cas10/Csm1 [Anaerolineales bacterium]